MLRAASQARCPRRTGTRKRKCPRNPARLLGGAPPRRVQGGCRPVSTAAALPMHRIHLEGARTHNLAGVSVDLVAGQLVAITGVSGAARAASRVDTLYAEGQRRFVESFSPYARQFLERLERPPMDRLEPVAAGVAVDRAHRSRARAPPSPRWPTSRPTSPRSSPARRCRCARSTASRPLRRDPAVRCPGARRGGCRSATVVTYPVRVPGTEAFLDVRERLLKRWVPAPARRRRGRGLSRSSGRRRPWAPRARRTWSSTGSRSRRAAGGRLAAAIEEAWRRGDTAMRISGSPVGGVRVRAGAGVPDVRARVRARPARALLVPVAGGRLPRLPRLRPHASASTGTRSSPTTG